MERETGNKDIYQVMVENLSEEVFLADAEGTVLYVNPASKKIMGHPTEQLIGKNVRELQQMGLFTESATFEVLEKKEIVNVIQILQNGKIVLATGVPIFKEGTDEVEMVVTTSKDMAALNELLDTIREQKATIASKEQEIKVLQEEMFIREGFVTSDPAMQEVKETIQRVAPRNVAVLIEGETGVGKEVVARTLHQFSDRKDKPLIKINCGIIPENLIESELFGYDRGAFTGAEKGGKKGKVELADGGTLFLDEIGELPLSMQVKLLDLLQDGSFTRVGGTEKKYVNARIVTATNRNLEAMCKNGEFRQDLYYRLNVIPVRVPPLRERPADIEALVKYFLFQNNNKYSMNKKMSREAMSELMTYGWPGNVRELQHVVERVCLMFIGEVILRDDVKSVLRANAAKLSETLAMNEIMPLKKAKQEVEKQILEMAKKQYPSTYKMAEALEVDQSTIVKLMKKYGL